MRNQLFTNYVLGPSFTDLVPLHLHFAEHSILVDIQ